MARSALSFFVLAAALLGGATHFPANVPVALRPFVIDHRAAQPSGRDLSFLLDGPAGAKGGIRGDVATTWFEISVERNSSLSSPILP